MLTNRLTMISIIGLLSMLMTILILMFPSEGLDAALLGVAIWWDVLFPALFPFFVISEILLGFGIVHFFGTLLDPIMRPLFRVPGIGGFVMAMGFASGYPVGARLTSKLWEQKLVSREEGERLVAFTSTSDPIFLIGAVSVGFFHDAGLAAIIVFSHYSAGIVVGLIMRYHGKSGKSTPPANKANGFILFRAFQAMHEARIRDGRTIGLLLQQAIESSLKLVFVIGGLVVFFSVVLELFTISQIMNILYILVTSLLSLFGLPEILSQAIVNGFFEVTLGAKSAGEVGSQVLLIHKTAIAAFILSWGGLSVHAQIVSLLSHTDLRYRPFFFARLIHGFIAASFVYLLWDVMQSSKDTFRMITPVWDSHTNKITDISWFLTSACIVFIGTIITIFCLFVVYLTCKAIQRRL